MKAIPGTGRWKEVSIEEAREKVSQSFRNNRRSRARPVKTILSPGAVISPRTILDGPRVDDVLFGRNWSHEGNRILRLLVDDQAATYEAASLLEKTEISEALVNEIKRAGGRFLKENDDGQWEELPDAVAREKVSKHFRNHRRIRTK